MRRTSPADEASSYGPAQLAVRFGISVACLLGASLILSHLSKSVLEGLSRLFFDRFGAWGERSQVCICLLRIPKLALYQQLVSWGWS